MKKLSHHIILSRILGFLFFLILLAIANAFVPSIKNSVYSNVIGFFDSNIIFLLGITLVCMINELFWSFYLPFNIIAPITGGILGVYIILFFSKAWNFLNLYFNFNFAVPITAICLAVFLLIVITGYIIILARGGKPEEDLNEWKRLHKEKLERNKKGKEIEWEDVGKEFKLFFYNLGKSINDSFEKPKKRKKK
jgi:hypothetical protein